MVTMCKDLRMHAAHMITKEPYDFLDTDANAKTEASAVRRLREASVRAARGPRGASLARRGSGEGLPVGAGPRRFRGTPPGRRPAASITDGLRRTEDDVV